MKIEVYLDNSSTPLEVLVPPKKFNLDSKGLSDGKHVLLFKTVDNQGNMLSQREVNFSVQNGPNIAIHGIKENATVSGDVGVLVNAYGSQIGDEFEPERIETPAPIPTWAWVLVLMVMAGCAGFLSTSLHNRPSAQAANSPAVAAVESTASGDGNAVGYDQKLGEQVYGNNCASCHQGSGTGLPGVFPPLKGNPAVLDDDPSDHINAIVNGLSGKVIDGVNYTSPMPPFGAALSDEEIAAVVNHERTRWGNNAKLISSDQVAEKR